MDRLDRLFCNMCDVEREYVIKDEYFDYEVKELTFNIKGKRAFCLICGNELFHQKYDTENQDLAFSLYRDKNGIVHPDEIRDIRKMYGLNQKDYSKLLGFGEITITRYENGSIPTQAQNQTILFSKDPQEMYRLFNQNKDKILESEQKRIQKRLDKLVSNNVDEKELIEFIRPLFNHPADVYSGYLKFDLEKFKQVVYFFAQRQRPYKTKLNKLMYYADNYFYKLHNRSITGARYIRHHYGPVPEKYLTLYENNNHVEILENEYGEFLKPLKKQINNVLTYEEIELLEIVNEKFHKMSSSEIKDYSHKEIGWIETAQSAFIKYSYAEHLNI